MFFKVYKKLIKHIISFLYIIMLTGYYQKRKKGFKKALIKKKTKKCQYASE